MINIREIAARVIYQVTEGHSLAECLRDELEAIKNKKRDCAFVQAVSYGVCRHYATLDVILSHLLKKPMKADDTDVHALIMVGLYQLRYMRVPQHAAVAETVNASAVLGKAWARGFINAILREYLREHEKIEVLIELDEEAQLAHPMWWIDATKKAWPNDWKSILNANNEHPPFSLRINAAKTTREKYLAENSAKITGSITPIAETEQGITLEAAIPVEDIPGFNQGVVSVQDGAAQLAASLLELKPNLRVLDACAAPGGKLTHILELCPELEACVAIESEAARMHLIHDNLKRLKQDATCICADAGIVKKWWDGKLFDRILLDAPCSASGVIRRHPDIKLLRQPTDIETLSAKQLDLLKALWPLLAPGGIFLYATCSIFPEENADVLRRFMAETPDASEKPLPETFGVKCEIGRQILPGQHGMDGFYYAKLVKI